MNSTIQRTLITKFNHFLCYMYCLLCDSAILKFFLFIHLNDFTLIIIIVILSNIKFKMFFKRIQGHLVDIQFSLMSPRTNYHEYFIFLHSAPRSIEKQFQTLNFTN